MDRLISAEQIPVRGDTSFGQPDKLLDEWRIGGVLPRLVRIVVRGSPILHRDDDGRKPCPHEFQIHDQPGGPAVSVPEGMDEDQIGQMQALGLTPMPMKKRCMRSATLRWSGEMSGRPE